MSNWAHYDDLPYEIIVQHLDDSGQAAKEYCEGRSNVLDEANRRAVNMGRGVDAQRYRYIVRDWTRTARPKDTHEVNCGGIMTGVNQSKGGG